MSTVKYKKVVDVMKHSDGSRTREAYWDVIKSNKVIGKIFRTHDIRGNLLYKTDGHIGGTVNKTTLKEIRRHVEMFA